MDPLDELNNTSEPKTSGLTRKFSIHGVIKWDTFWGMVILRDFAHNSLVKL